jgi:RNA polymerase sigma factor (sigma-70 family)
MKERPEVKSVETGDQPLSENVSRTLSADQFTKAYILGWPLTARFLRYRGASEDTAQEISQAAWVKGWECLGQLREPEMVVSWVNSIAKNLWTDSMRDRQKYQRVSEESRLVSPSIAILELKRILGACSTTDRYLLTGAYIEGRSTEELAKSLSITPVALRVRLSRLLKRLQTQAEQTVTPNDLNRVHRSRWQGDFLSGDSERHMLQSMSNRRGRQKLPR